MLSRKTETAISIAGLAAMIIILASVFYIQADYNLERLGVVVDGIAGATQSIEAIFDVSDDFVPFSAPETYLEGELYEKINGKAPLYTSVGFEKLMTQRFTFVKEPDIWIEIYLFKMSSPEAAYSVYSTQRRANVQTVGAISSEHSYKTTSGLYLVNGSDYFEIVSSAENEDLLDAIAGSIEQIAGIDGEDTDFLALPQVLPQRASVEGSSKLYIGSAFGIDNLGMVYVRNYEVGGDTLTAFWIEDGKKAAARFQTFMRDNGIEKIAEVDGIAIYDLFGVYELITLTDNGLIGIHEAYDFETAAEFLKSLQE